ncbi:hypothetical protein WICMUC_002751 [Wickerhamomyces mucosus]|uniref:Cullin family profile domain-containing protein n=1 Tax=Wickerhamomyces mucosus TaxID=1378264 RepID=A0A9P8PPV7_9ASCO|nr:hypothetical protein WICMUC_002751 [Wickerhamomyces mucosus]
MVTSEQFTTVFGLPDISPDSDTEIVSGWLMNHEHNEPSQRVRASLKLLSGTSIINSLISQYISQLRIDALDIEVHDLKRLSMIKDYFMFPINYIQVTQSQFTQLERAVNSIIRSKIIKLESVTKDQAKLVSSIGLDTNEIQAFNYEQFIKSRISTFAKKWEKSFIIELNDDNVAINEYLQLRISEIFDIVNNYPMSLPAIQDLKKLIKPIQRAALVTSFVTKCQTHVLHAGTNTDDIIAFYTSTIKVFLIIDPRGVLLDNSSRPIRRYLKERNDTISIIVHSILGGDDHKLLSHLSDELRKENSRVITKLSLDWFPDPIDALPDFKEQDIIESLMSIFENKESLIDVLIESFAKRLLKLKSKEEIHEIVSKLEQLRSRFEDNELNNIEVMINDIKTSELTDQKIHATNPLMDNNLQFSLLSYLYWPEMDQLSFKLPDSIQSQIDSYSEEFAKLKKGRYMKWINSGFVSLDLTISGETKTFQVSPAKAFVLNMFNEKNEIEVGDAISELGIGERLAFESLEFWVKENVLLKREDIYSPNE